MTPSLEAARACLRAGQWAEAVAHYQVHLQGHPADVGALIELSQGLEHLGLLDEAVVMTRTAQRAAAADVLGLVQLRLADLYQAQGRTDEAGALYSQCLTDPALATRAAVGVARSWLQAGYPSRALQALAPHAQAAEVQATQALALFESGQVEAACHLLDRRMQTHAALTPHELSNLLMFANYSTAYSRWLARVRPRLASVFASQSQLLRRAPTRSGQPRIGWVSADLYAHPVGYFLAGFLPHLAQTHDLFFYSNGAKEDLLTQELRACAQGWRSIRQMDAQQAAQCMADDGLDLLIDLSGHTEGHRLDVFALRPCGRQASFLGYFSTTLLPQMDWLITDAWHLPPGETDRMTEKPWVLPHSRFCYQAPQDGPEPAATAPLALNGHLTWGAFVNVAKIGPECIALWSQLLRAAPDSRLVLRWKSLVDQDLRQRLRQAFGAQGIAPGRVEMLGASRHRELLQGYAEIDVALDTWPFSGATTSCEALWMGVPVVTLPSDRPAGRQTASILETLGKSQWIARDAQDFVRIALAWAQDPAALQAARSGLRPAMQASTLADGRSYAHHFALALKDLLAQPPGRSGGLTSAC